MQCSKVSLFSNNHLNYSTRCSTTIFKKTTEFKVIIRPCLPTIKTSHSCFLAFWLRLSIKHHANTYFLRGYLALWNYLQVMVHFNSMYHNENLPNLTL